MKITELIEKKKQGLSLTEEEIYFIVICLTPILNLHYTKNVCGVAYSEKNNSPGYK